MTHQASKQASKHKRNSRGLLAAGKGSCPGLGAGTPKPGLEPATMSAQRQAALIDRRQKNMKRRFAVTFRWRAHHAVAFVRNAHLPVDGLKPMELAGCMAPEQVLSAQQRRTGCSGARWRDARTRTLLLELIHQAPTQVGLTK